MSDGTIVPEDLARLAAKLRSLDLDAGEAAALRTILLRASEGDVAEVEGFGSGIGSLGFDVGPTTSFKGTDEELAARGGMSRGFKGTDEELQALVDWLTEPR